MRVIFSRKGFDSAAGGCPSPVVNGRPYSLPIPARTRTRVRYRDLPNDSGRILCSVTNDDTWMERHCHLDPDLDAQAMMRRPDWRGAFGQVGRAQGHLRNQAVAEGDLFLFFGLFRAVHRVNGRWRFEGASEHRVFGWLQIENVVTIGENPADALRTYPWLADHPHTDGDDEWPESNTVYVSRRQLRIDGLRRRLPGWGLFRDGYRLTAGDSSQPSLWEVPDWLNPVLGGVGLSCHDASRFDESGRLRSVGRGQEFVAHTGERRDAAKWLARFFEGMA